MANALSIREAVFADYEQIAAVEAANKLECETRERWVRLWTENPAYRKLAGEWPIGWVLDTKDGGIAGTISNIPLACAFRGKEWIAAVGRGWAVEARRRGFALLLLGKFARQPGVDLFLSTTATGASAAAFERLHWRRPPVGQWDTSGFWIASYGGLMASCLPMVPGGKWLSRVFAPPLAGADSVIRRMRGSSRRDPDLSFASGFDDRFDEFWEEMKSREPETLLAVRSRDALQWQFECALADNRAWILAAYRGRKLLAYGIFERRDNAALGLKRVRIIDFQASEDRRGFSEALLARALERCRREGIHVLENVGCWFEGERCLGRPAPFHHKLASWSYFYKSNPVGLGQALENTACWHPTSLEGDASY